MNLEQLKTNLKILVKSDNRSAERISTDAGLSRDYLRNILAGRSRNPRQAGLEALAASFGIPIEKLLGNEVKEPETAKKSRKRLSMTELLIALHQEYSPGSFVQLIRNAGYFLRIRSLQDNRARWKSGRKIEMKPLDTRIRHVAVKPRVQTVNGKQRLIYEDSSGVWQITLEGRYVLFLAKVHLTTKNVVEYLAGTETAIIALENVLNVGMSRVRTKPPKSGLWEIGKNHITKDTYFRPYKIDVASYLAYRVHPMYTAIKDDMEVFFEGIDFWTRYGGTGTKKIMLTGPPGTGKTTIVKALFAEFHKKYLCVMASESSGGLFILSASSVAENKRKAIVLCEEVDRFRKGQANSDVLNFLDGIDTPINPAGTYFIFTTNYPRSVDPRILKRPGRIDKVFRVGAFRTSAAADAAKLYLPDDAAAAVDHKQLGRALDRTTPAEIRIIISDALKRARTEKLDFSVKLVEDCRKELKDSLKAVEEGDIETPESRENDRERYGEIEALADDFEENQKQGL